LCAHIQDLTLFCIDKSKDGSWCIHTHIQTPTLVYTQIQSLSMFSTHTDPQSDPDLYTQV